MFRSFARNTCLLLLFHVPTAAPQTAEARLTLQTAVARSLERNFDLKAFGHEVVAQAGRLQQARARPNWEVGVIVENALGSGHRRDFDAAETTLSLGFVLEHGARERRIEVARAGGDVFDTEMRIRRLDVAAETARRFLAVLASQELLKAARQATQLADETTKAVQVRVRAAKVPQAEEARAEAQLARVRLDQEHAEHELASARQRLAALWGSTKPDFGEVSGDLLKLPPLADFESLREALKDNAQVDRLVSEKRLRETEVRLAEMRRRPPWHVTAGVRRFEDGSDHAFVVGLTVPIATRDYAEGAIKEARAQSSRIDAHTDALQVQLDAELFGIYQELRHSYAEVDTLRNTVLPRMESAVEQSRYAYQRGRYGYFEWVTTQRELVELRRALLEASADAHRQRIEIERLTGATLVDNLLE